MKINKFVIVLLVIALFIPTYIGIANYLYIKIRLKCLVKRWKGCVI